MQLMGELLKCFDLYLGEFRVRWRKMVLCGDARYLPGQVGIAFCCLTASCVSAFWGPDRWNLSYFFRVRVQFGANEIIGSAAVWVHSTSELIATKLCLICTTPLEQLVRLRPTPKYSQGLGCRSAPLPCLWLVPEA